MSGTTITATIVGVDKASPALDKVGAKAQETGGKVSGAAKLMGGALAGIGVASFLKTTVEKFSEAQQSTLLLQSAFERFPKLGDSTAGAIEEIGKALQNKTKFDDDANNAAAAQLAQFDLTGKQIEQLLPLVDDYAAKTGKDLPTAASDLGKAFLGNNKSLKEIGINFHATGDRATDFTSIFGLLSAKVGGFAEEQGKTAAGQLSILGNQFDDMEKTIGSAVVPALTQLGKIAIPIATAVAGAVGTAVEVFDGLPGPVKAGVLALGGYVALQKLGVFEKLSGAVTSFKTAIAETTAQAEANGVAMTKWQATTANVKSGIGSLAKSLAAPAGIMAATVVVSDIVSSFQAWDDAAQAVKDETSSLTDQLVQDGGKWSDATEKQLQQATSQTEVFQDLVKSGADYATTMDFLTGKQVKAGAGADSLKSALGKLPPVLAQQAFQMTGVKNAAIDGAASLLQYQAAQDAAAKAAADQIGPAMAGGAAAFRLAEQASDSAYVSYKNYSAMVLHSAPQIRGAVTEDGKTWKAYGQSLPVSTLAALHEPLNGIDTALANNARSAQIAAAKAQDLKDIQKELAEKTQLAREKQVGLVRSLGDLGSSLYDSTGKLRDLNDATSTLVQNMDRAKGIVPSVTDATRDWRQSLADADQKVLDADGHVKMYGKSILDSKGNIVLASQAGRDLSVTMEDQQGKAAALATALGEQAAKTGGARAGAVALSDSLKKSKKDFLDNAAQMGLTAAQAKILADKYFAIPSAVTTIIKVDAAQAKIDLAQFAADHTIAIKARIVPTSASGYAVTANAAYADGGWADGPGTGTSDSIPARLSKGEFVVNAAAASRWGGFLEGINGGGGTGGSRYAGGGWARSGGMSVAPQLNFYGPIIGSDPRALALWMRDVIRNGSRNGIQVMA